jgi:predicted dehydrogenase
VVGTGGISRTTAGDLHLTENLDLVAVASRTIENAAAFADEYEVPRAYGDYDSLFADDDIDVVYIGTPIATHAELARRALLAGKHVLVEKAFTTTAAEARALAALAAEQGRFLMEAMWMRFNPAIELMLDELADGAVGDVLSVQAGFGIPFPRTTNIWRPELGGGALLDMGVYPVTLAHLVLGAPDTLEATGEMRADGLFAHALTSLAGPVNPVASIGGTEGIVSFEAPFFATDSFRVVLWPDMESRTEAVDIEGAGYVPMFRAVCEAIEDGLLEHPLRPLRDTIDVLKTMDEVRRQLAVVH